MRRLRRGHGWGTRAGRAVLAAAPDGRVAVAWGDSAQEGGRTSVVPALPGGNLPVASYGTRPVFGMPREGAAHGGDRLRPGHREGR
ncbi:hypothetical protein, partial [Nonomuraea diastatica]